MARKPEATGFNPLGWMLTFSDLITLLLTFFVLLLALKAPEAAKLKAAFGIFEQGVSVSDSAVQGGKINDYVRGQEAAKDNQGRALSEKEGLPGLATPELPASLQGKVTLKRETRGTVLTVSNDLLFPVGGYTLSPQAKKILREMAGVIVQSNLPVSVEGHTDSSKLRAGAGVASNRELSLRRALAVLDVLRKAGVADSRLRVAALADTRPLTDNKTPEHRAMNRRTEIVLLSGANQP